MKIGDRVVLTNGIILHIRNSPISTTKSYQARCLRTAKVAMNYVFTVVKIEKHHDTVISALCDVGLKNCSLQCVEIPINYFKLVQ